MQEQPKIATPKNWQWAHDTTFEVSGKTLELFLHLKNSILSNPESQKVIMALQLDELLQKVVEEGIKSGKITDGSKVPTELNHWSQLQGDSEKLRELFGLGTLPQGTKGEITTYSILNQGYPIWIGDYWIPEEEYKIINSLSDELEYIQFGYVQGQSHHLGKIADKYESPKSNTPGYQFWIEVA